MGSRNRFNPHTLPDSGHRGVPDPTGIHNLLSTRLEVIVSRVRYLYHQSIGSTLEVRSDIEPEMSVASGVAADLDIVDIDISSPVDRVEVEHQPLSLPRRRDGKGCPIPKGIVSRNSTSNSRKG